MIRHQGSSMSFFTTLAGFPIAKQLSGIELTATLPIDKIEFFPIVVPSVIIHAGLIQEKLIQYC